MIIDGRMIADRMLDELKQKVQHLKRSGITPTLTVILVGDNPASLSYIKQKQKAATKIGVRVILEQLDSKSPGLPKSLKSLIEKYNNDPAVHALIVQRPLPKTTDEITTILNSISLVKDVDGFLPNSPFQPPVALAVMRILADFYKLDQFDTFDQLAQFITNKHIVIIGRGETAGRPIAQLLQKLGAPVHVVHSQTPNPDAVIKTADIVISCVGKPNVVRPDNVRPGVVLISVGIYRDPEGKLHGDYDQGQVAPVASFYTPTPGGVGPVNVAALMENVVVAAKKSA